MLKQIPNALTLLRLMLAPVVALLFMQGMAAGLVPANDDRHLRFIAANFTVAAVLFVVAALTDLFDGMLARALNAQSKFGRLIDPIADKVIVGLPLIAIVLAMWIGRHPFWPLAALATAVIVIRDVTMTLVRLSSADGEGVRVSFLAKIKTALELVVVGSLLGACAISANILVAATDGAPWMQPFVEMFEWAWLAALVITAALSAWTGLQYLRPKPAA